MTAPRSERYWRREKFAYARAENAYAWGAEERKEALAGALWSAREGFFDAHSHKNAVLWALFLGAEMPPLPQRSLSQEVDTGCQSCYPGAMSDKRRWVIEGVSDETRRAVAAFAALGGRTIASVLEDELAGLVDHMSRSQEVTRSIAVAEVGRDGE